MKKTNKSKSQMDQFLCKLADLDELSVKSFIVKIKRNETSIFVVRKDDQVYAYQNSCPHTQAPLEWTPDQFLDENNENIICALHGARFTIEEGACIDGPCNGVGLSVVNIKLEEGNILLDT